VTYNPEVKVTWLCRRIANGELAYNYVYENYDMPAATACMPSRLMG